MVNKMCLETQIRALAAQGHSRKQAALTLGIPVGKMKLICDSITGLTWQRDQNIRVRRQTGVGHDSAIGENTRRAKDQRNLSVRQETFSLKGIEGTLIELMTHYKVMWTIGTVRKRLATGMTLEEAFASGRPKVRDWSACAW